MPPKKQKQKQKQKNSITIFWHIISNFIKLKIRKNPERSQRGEKKPYERQERTEVIIDSSLEGKKAGRKQSEIFKVLKKPPPPATNLDFVPCKKVKEKIMIFSDKN